MYIVSLALLSVHNYCSLNGNSIVTCIFAFCFSQSVEIILIVHIELNDHFLNRV